MVILPETGDDPTARAKEKEASAGAPGRASLVSTTFSNLAGPETRGHAPKNCFLVFFGVFLVFFLRR